MLLLARVFHLLDSMCIIEANRQCHVPNGIFGVSVTLMACGNNAGMSRKVMVAHPPHFTSVGNGPNSYMEVGTWINEINKLDLLSEFKIKIAKPII